MQEQEKGNIEVKKQNELESSDANLDIKSRMEKLTKLYEDGILTEEEYQKKKDELVSLI